MGPSRGVLPAVNVSSPSTAAARVALAASRIAVYLTDGRLPPEKDLFVLSAAVVHAGRAGDPSALRAAVDSARALLEVRPHDACAEYCRGYLNATAEFAWLLLGSSDEALLRGAGLTDQREAA